MLLLLRRLTAGHHSDGNNNDNNEYNSGHEDDDDDAHYMLLSLPTEDIERQSLLAHQKQIQLLTQDVILPAAAAHPHSYGIVEPL